jgi:hypothetical protein
VVLKILHLLLADAPLAPSMAEEKEEGEEAAEAEDVPDAAADRSTAAL